MPRVKIKQLDERTATAGVHFDGPQERRKLEPGEIVEIPADMQFMDKGSLFDVLFATGKLEITLDPVTRPLQYANYREAQLCSPSFKSRGPDEDLEVDQARAAVAERMANDSDVPGETGSPADDDIAAVSSAPVIVPDPVDLPDPPVSNRRAARRATAQAAGSGAENTT